MITQILINFPLNLYIFETLSNDVKIKFMSIETFNKKLFFHLHFSSLFYIFFLHVVRFALIALRSQWAFPEIHCPPIWKMNFSTFCMANLFNFLL